jgi:hypothetical protein
MQFNKKTKTWTMRVMTAGVFLCILLAFWDPKTLYAQVGDRAVLAINNVTYTQRQIEMYIVVKESLRKNNSVESARVVNAGNWNEAVTVFTEDMIIYQEAQRLGGLQAPDQLVEKFVNLIQEKSKKSDVFRSTMIRLGADQVGITQVLDSVIRIASFRRSKDRQASTSDNSGEIEDQAGAIPEWLTEITDRAIVRRYEGTNQFLDIAPNSKGPTGGK